MPFVPLDSRLAQHIVVLSHADPPDKIDHSQALPAPRRRQLFCRDFYFPYSRVARGNLATITTNAATKDFCLSCIYRPLAGDFPLAGEFFFFNASERFVRALRVLERASPSVCRRSSR